MEKYGKTLHVQSDDWMREHAIGRVLNGYTVTKDGREVSGGLYDKTIFGSDRECNCFRHKRTPGTCSCGVTIYPTEKLANTFAYYESKIPVINYVLFDTFIGRFANKCPTLYNAIAKLHGTSDLTLEHLWATTFGAATEGEGTGITVDLGGGVTFKLAIGIVDEQSSSRSVGLIGLKSISRGTIEECDTNWLNSSLTTVIPVPPTIYRPWQMLYTNGERKPNTHPLTSLYSAFIITSEWLNYSDPSSFIYKKLVGKELTSIDFATLCFGLQNMYARLMESNQLLAASKQSTIRSIPRQRVTRSGRTTITSDPDLPLDTVGVPFSIFYEAVKVDIINEITKLYPEEDAINLYLTLDEKAIETTRALAEQSCVCIERPPTAHKYNIMAFLIQLHQNDDITLKLNPLVCDPFNADFDGDQMSMWFIVDHELAEKAMKKMSPRSFWVYEKNSKAIFQPSASNLLGLHYLTNANPIRKDSVPSFATLDEAEEAFVNGAIDFDQLISVGAINSSYGRLKVSELIGKDIDEVIGKENAISAKNIADIMSAMYPYEDRLERLKVLQDLGLRAVTEIGVTFLTPTEMAKLSEGIPGVDEILNNPSIPNEQKVNEIEKLVSTTIKERAESIPSLMSQISGSDKVTLKQLNEITMGKVSFHDGIPQYSNDSLIRGATERTYAEHAMTERSISAVKTTLTPLTGYLGRQLVDTADEITFVSDYNPTQKIGALIPSEQAVGRTDMEGNVITSIKPNTTVRVKSFAIEEGDTYGSVFFRPDIYKYTDGGKVGIGLLTSLSEQVLQQSLELKHAGTLARASDECFTSRFSGVIKEIGTRKFVIESNGKRYAYPLPEKYNPTKGFTQGAKVEVGQTLFFSARIIAPDERFLNISSMIGASIPARRKRTVSLSIAMGKGKVEYNFNNYTIKFNGIESSLDPEAVYYYADGEEVESYEFLCSGLLNMGLLSKCTTLDEGERFYAFFKTLQHFFGKLHCEQAEMLYHVMKRHGALRPISKILTNDLSFVSSMNYGYNKRALKRFLEQDIENSFLTSFIMGAE